MKYNLFLTILFLISSFNSKAGDAEILTVQIKQQSTNDYHISVTLHHQDSGWQHYADAWRIVDDKGNVLGTRTLFHPHVNEQPFTRSLKHVKVNEHLTTLYIEAHDNVHGWSKNRLQINLNEIQNGQLTVKRP